MNISTTNEIKNVSCNNKVLTVLPETYRIIESIYVLFSLYIIISFIFFLLRPYLTNFKVCGQPQRKVPQRNSDEPSTTSYEDKNSTCRKSGNLHRQHRYQMYARVAMTSLTVLMSIMVLVHVTMDLWAYSDKNTTSAYVQCVRHIVSGLFYIICAFCLYGFLWIRQRAFYAHPVLKHLAKPCLIRFSWSVLATIIIAVSSITVLFFLPQIQKIHQKYAVNNSTVPLDSYEIDYAAYGIVPLECGFQRKDVYLGLHLTITIGFLYFQISLQILFAYPIFKQKRQRKEKLKFNKSSSSNLSLKDERFSNGSLGRTTKSCITYDTVIEVEKTSVRLSSESGLGFQTDDICESPVFVEDANSGLTMKMFRYEGDYERPSRRGSSVQMASFVVRKESIGNCMDTFIPISDRTGLTHEHRDLHHQPKSTMASSQLSDSSGISSNPNKFQSTISQAKNTTSKGIRKVSAKFSSVRFKELRRRTTRRTVVERRSRRARAHLRAYVIRCLCVSIICSVSDVIAFLLSFFAQFHYHEDLIGIHSGVTESLVTSLAYNANVIINLLCMLACYKDWRARLCPWYYLYKDFKNVDKA